MRLTLSKNATYFLKVRQDVRKISSIFLTVAYILFFSSMATAYPDFISYGYRSCVTCHFNGSGGGGLNDYGRAVWASELVSKKLFHKKMTDEQMGEASGFPLLKESIPWWLRPGVKYRGLQLIRDPGSKDAIEQWINMQAEANAAAFLDKEQKIMLYGSYGYRPLPPRYKGSTGDKPEEWITREHYVRWMAREDLHLYAGLMDKVFGIKHPDHTSFNRTRTQLTMDDQSHGVLAHWIKEDYELTGQYFLGNLQQKEKLRHSGFNVHFDKAISERRAWGVSYLNSQNDFSQRQMMSGQIRLGLRNPGNSFLGEAGLVEEKPKGGKAATGMYTFFQSSNRVTRGYYGIMRFETWKSDISKNSGETYRYGFGLLSFPWMRTEIRVDIYNQRTIVPGQANEDTWVAAGQIHLSI